MATTADLRRARAMRAPELLAQIRRLARQLGWDAALKGPEPGWPDLVLAKNGVLLFRLLKTEQGAVTPQQQRWIRHLRTAGLDVAIWRPRDLLDGSVHRQLYTSADRPLDARELAIAPSDR